MQNCFLRWWRNGSWKAGVGSDDWYRGADWDEEARAFFEKKIARARYQKPFYLWVKAEAIAPEHPDDAEALFERSLEADVEGNERARALTARARARARRAMAGGSLDDLAEAARFETMGNSGLITTARWDYAALVGMRRERSRYREALKFLGVIGRTSFAGQVALAFIHYDKGHRVRARRAANKALGIALSKDEVVPGVPSAPPFPNPLYDRLLVIAEKWDEAELGSPPPVWPDPHVGSEED